jgi:hypothetical protein
LTSPVTEYMAPMPVDAGKDDAGKKDAAGPMPLYMAVMPDGGPLMRYMAVMPPEAGVAQPDYMAVFPPLRDGGGVTALYMAPLPTKH